LRVAVIDYDFCKPNKCNLECITFCPINRSGSTAIELSEAVKGKPIIYEETCIGCGICVKKCPFQAISIVNLPDQFTGEIIHRYRINGFELFGLPTLKSGSIIGIIGKNGTGKTTVLRILSGELLPNFGDPTVKLNVDQILEKFKGKEIYNYFSLLYSKRLKVVHKIQYIESLTKYLKGNVRELLSRIDERGLVNDIKSMLNMEEFWDRDIKVLSGGELQKVTIAAALLRNADVYLFDEPSSYLDIKERLNMAKTIRELTKGKYVVIVEHDLVVLDYLVDLINIIYGESGVYGKVSKTYSARAGINNFLKGYLPAENMRIRDYEIQFMLKEFSDFELNDATTILKWSDLEKKLNGFELRVKSGEIRNGEVIGIVGKNGIGKTTFIRILAEELHPDIGYVYSLRTKLAYKPQKIEPNRDITVQKFLEEVSKDALSTSSWFFEEIIRRLGIHKILESNIKELSGGELQKVYVTATLAQDADIYLFDEPSSYLDVEERYIVAKAIKRVTRERKVITVIVEHDLAIHNYIADKLIVFSGIPGKIGIGSNPMSLKEGMNEFLKEVEITFRRDMDTGRPRVNKIGSYLDRLQKERGEYYSTEYVKD
jgi:ATP-binding cassette subfamily E protein 1